ncbi:MAG: hypothetical protein DIU74_003585, partial [Pseudomonadota bacterium]
MLLVAQTGIALDRAAPVEAGPQALLGSLAAAKSRCMGQADVDGRQGTSRMPDRQVFSCPSGRRHPARAVG